ncbi:MAG TPA: hypothetical protein VHS31_04325 [Tepidisphaeraceae bacterium]|jgi:hypothetical protein|nr:hypothetical protein [Tepidisphaeraceae bacterium]
MNKSQRTNDPAQNPDPITKAPGSHPTGTGVGAAVGGAAGVAGAIATGAAIGTTAGPVGTAVGAVVGAVAGGLVGKGMAEGINPTAEHAYWRENYFTRPYFHPGTSYEEYGPAYQYGWESFQKYSGKKFEEVEADLGRDWDRAKGKSQLKWDAAKHASRDAWKRTSAESE